jgi:hypothetical protein
MDLSSLSHDAPGAMGLPHGIIGVSVFMWFGLSVMTTGAITAAPTAASATTHPDHVAIVARFHGLA